MNETPTPFGFCQCGCGAKTNISQETRIAKGVIRGLPRRFLPGHTPNLFLARFWKRVVKSSGCWNWSGARTWSGYGEISFNGDRHTRVHRVSWILHYGSIPETLCVLHHCDNRICVRPDHLFLGTRADNALDMASKGRSTHGERNPMAKIPDTIVYEMRRRLLSGEKYRDLVVEFSSRCSVKEAWIRYILRGDFRKHQLLRLPPGPVTSDSDS